MSWSRQTKIASAICIILCASCAHTPVKGRVAELIGGPHPGRPTDFPGADWSKTKNLLAYNAKGTDGAYHIYTVKPDGTDAAQLGAGSASFPKRSTGTPVWGPSGAFIAFVAEKSSHPGSSVTAPPGWGSYSDLWVANRRITRVAAHRRRHRQGPRHDHPGVLSQRPAARMDRAH